MRLKELFRIFDFGLINFNVERFYELVLHRKISIGQAIDQSTFV